LDRGANLVVVSEIFPIGRKAKGFEDRSCFQTAVSVVVYIWIPGLMHLNESLLLWDRYLGCTALPIYPLILLKLYGNAT
jgi:hypothetical protein